MIKKILHTRTFKVTVFIFICAVIYLSPGFSWNLRVLGLRQKITLNNSVNLNPNIYQVDILKLDASHYLLHFVDEKNGVV